MGTLRDIKDLMNYYIILDEALKTIRRHRRSAHEGNEYCWRPFRRRFAYDHDILNWNSSIFICHVVSRYLHSIFHIGKMFLPQVIKSAR